MISKSPFQPYFFYDSVINFERSLASLLLKIMGDCRVFCSGIPDFPPVQTKVELCAFQWREVGPRAPVAARRVVIYT